MISKRAEETSTNLAFYIVRLVIAIPAILFIFWAIGFGITVFTSNQETVDTFAYTAIISQLHLFLDESKTLNTTTFQTRLPVMLNDKSYIHMNNNRLCVLSSATRTPQNCKHFPTIDSIEIINTLTGSNEQRVMRIINIQFQKDKDTILDKTTIKVTLELEELPREE